MEPLMAVVVGLLFAASIYMILRRSIVKLVIGLILLSNAANLTIFTAAGMREGNPPLIPDDPDVVFPETMYCDATMVPADPLPQALVLTAIVIAFGVLAFAVVLINRAHEIVGVDDLDEMNTTDKTEEL